MPTVPFYKFFHALFRIVIQKKNERNTFRQKMRKNALRVGVGFRASLVFVISSEIIPKYRLNLHRKG